METILDLIERASHARWLSLVVRDAKAASELGRIVAELDAEIGQRTEQFRRQGGDAVQVPDP